MTSVQCPMNRTLEIGHWSFLFDNIFFCVKMIKIP